MTGLSSDPLRWSCDIGQRMANFDSCQFVFIHMANITDNLVSIFVQDLV